MYICSFNGVNARLCRQAVFLMKLKIPPVYIVRKKHDDSNPDSLYNMPKEKKTRQDAKVIENISCKKETEEPVCKESSQNNNANKWLLGLLIAAGFGGLAYYLWRRSDESGQNSSTEVPVSVPLSKIDLPKHVPYLLIGGGTASFSAFRAIKSNDPKAKVLMLTNEYLKPYMRPPLSKELWYTAQQEGEVTKDYRFKQWTGAERSLFFEPDEFFVEPTKLIESENGGIAVAPGCVVKKIDPSSQVATLADGTEVSYDQCLIATGCSPKNLSVFSDAPSNIKDRVMLFRTPGDFEKLKKFADNNKSITIVGNGFLGSELACSLSNYAKHKKLHINQIFSESGNMSKILPEYLSKWTMKKMETLGVCVIPNVRIKEAKRDEDSLKLALSNGTTLLSDVVVVCVGCEANTELGSASGLEIDSNLGGFVVNAELEARRNLFVAGDVSCFYDPLLGRRRVEHHDHSVVSGRLAGENMVGKKKSYTHQSMFWSDLGPEIGYEGIGQVDASLPTVGVFALPSKSERSADNLNGTGTSTSTKSDNTKQIKDDGKNILSDVNIAVISAQEPTATATAATEDDEYGRGVIFYIKNDKIVGILLWNIFNRIGLARTVINENRRFEDLNEVAKLFEIHS